MTTQLKKTQSDTDSYVSNIDSFSSFDGFHRNHEPSCSSSDDEAVNAEEKAKLNLTTWGIEANIPRCHVNSLLKILKNDGGLQYLPSDWRTLAKANLRRGKLIFRQVPPGRYGHLGLANGIILALLSMDVLNLPDSIELIINVDGLPVSKSSGSQFWPILGRIFGLLYGFTFVIGIYHGFKKPEKVNIFLSDFVEEFLKLRRGGLMVESKQIQVSVVGLVCDAPARSFMTSVVLHTSYESCHKCVTVGAYVKNASGKRGGRVTYPETITYFRTDASF